MTKEPWLDVLLLERLAQERIGEQIDLANGQIVGGAPVGVESAASLSDKTLSDKTFAIVSSDGFLRQGISGNLDGSGPPKHIRGAPRAPPNCAGLMTFQQRSSG